LNNLQRRTQCPLGVFFVRLRPTEVSENPVADVARDETVVARDDFATDRSIGVQQRAQFFRIEFFTELAAVLRDAPAGQVVAVSERAEGGGAFLVGEAGELIGVGARRSRPHRSAG
jgi:hypothetical protein